MDYTEISEGDILIAKSCNETDLGITLKKDVLVKVFLVFNPSEIDCQFLIRQPNDVIDPPIGDYVVGSENQFTLRPQNLEKM